MAKPKKAKRREKKNIPHAHAHIQSTFNNTIVTISDPNGDLNGYWFDHPAVDPIDGRFLNNVLTVNGLTISNGRNFK